MLNFKSELSIWYAHLLKIIPGSLGCKIRKKFLIFESSGYDVEIWEGTHIDYPKFLVLGDRVSINRGCNLNCAGGITIGSDVLIGPRVTIYSQNHLFSIRKRKINKQGYEHGRVIIENDVWIAANVTILPGVKIAEGCVIGAGSIVTSSTEPFSLYVGNPARKVKDRI